ncbi:MAG: cation:proton antiporter [Betaproteobacteria bacterium]|nr:cation:proton antiporter [Betaproteobacteria bacterium]
MDAVAAGDAATARTFGILAMLIVLAKAASFVERFKQPAVLGEIAMGVIVGNLFLIGFDFFEPAKKDPILLFLAEFGVVVLLFQIGLESSVSTMVKVGMRALMVAVVGVAAPFVIGVWFVGPVLFPGGSFNTYLFFGATLTATSVGITARVFQDMGTLQSREAQIVLGAAVIDDVIGLIILAIVSAVVKSGTVSLVEVLVITGKAAGFLVGVLVAGRYLARFFTGIFIRINTGLGVKLALAMGTCLMFAYVSSLFGLAPIVGAFAAGLILDEVYFRGFADATIADDVRAAVKDSDASTAKRVGAVLERHARHHLETLMAPISFVLVPLFFIYTGMQVNLVVLNDAHLVLVALGVTFVAFAGKLVSGIVAGPVNKWIVGWGMAPRGEVGLIFAVVGKQLGVVDDEEYAAIIIMVMLTTLLTPLVLAWLIKRQR